MIKKITLGFGGLLISVGSFAAAKQQPTAITITGGEPVNYHCNNGKSVVARYYGLSDNSLDFVKLNLNGAEYTLPRVVSASGVRYTDEFKIEWWTKDGALLDEDVNDDKSKLAECKEVSIAQQK